MELENHPSPLATDCVLGMSYPFVPEVATETTATGLGGIPAVQPSVAVASAIRLLCLGQNIDFPMAESTERDFQQALSFHKARRYGEAQAMYRDLLADDPGNLDITLLLGILAAQTDHEDEACDLLAEVIHRDPLNGEALKWYAGVLSFKDRHAEAEHYAVRAVSLLPQDYDARLKLSTAYFGQQKLKETVDTFLGAIRLNPVEKDAYYGLATTYLRMGEPFRARDILRDAVHIQTTPESLLKLGEVCLACEDPHQAILCAQGVLARKPQDTEALILLVRAYRNAQMEHQEDEALQRLRSVSPDDQLGHTLFGRRLQSLGHFADAEKEFQRSIEIKREQGVAYYGITAGRRIAEADRELVQQMERVVNDGDMNQDERAHLHFALGKAYDNLGQYGDAMAHFDLGNKLMRELRMGVRKFDREAAVEQVDRIIELFTADFLDIQAEKMAKQPALTPQPIFIAGIMRSGTTLAEQILSCHPMVGGGGEQGFWRPAEPECVNYSKHTVFRDTIRTKAKQYVDLLAKVAPDHPYVTDKNPANRMVYGLLHIAFPNSRIIHMRRNPIDVAISIYTTLIRTGAPFVGDRDDIVFALKEHERLVAHWKSVLPEDRLIEVRYEELVRDREAQTRRIVEFCGLPWDEACLHPEDNLRTVVTPSFWQVRQPVYSASVERWKKYEPWLGPFAELAGN